MKMFQDLVSEAGQNGLSYMAIGPEMDAFDKYQELLGKHGEKNINLAINVVYFQVLDSLRREVFILDKMKFDSEDDLSMCPVDFIDKACSKGRCIPRGVMAHGPFYDENLDQKAFLDCVNDIYPKAVMLMAKELVNGKITRVNKHRDRESVSISKDMEIALVASRLLSVPLGCNLIPDRMKELDRVKIKNIKEGPTEGRLGFVEKLEGSIKKNKDFSFSEGRSIELEKMLSAFINSTDYSVSHDTEYAFFRIAKMQGLSESMRVVKPMYDGKVLQAKHDNEMSV